MIEPNASLREILRRHPETRRIFQEFGVDSCCGGGFSIEKTAGMSGIDMDALLKALNKVATAK